MAALSDQEIVQSSPLATVTRECIIIRDADGHSQTVIALDSLSTVKKIKSSYPGLLVISGGLSVIAAAAASSKDGHGAGIPIALLALGFAVAYVGTRRASVAFAVGAEITETVAGSLKDAANLMEVVQTVRPQQSEAA